MANEFKIRKGLIVEGASGGTVVDVQGSQGQLFSVTDDLSGSIFAVSDISGVPILDVNSSGLSTFYGNVNLPDNKKILLGTGSDLEIYHNGNDSYIKDAGTGDLRIVASATKIYDADMSHFQASFTDGGSVDLYYGGNKKFETTNTGVSVTGNGIFTGDVGIGITNPYSVLDVNSAISSSSVDVITLTQATNGNDKPAASFGLSIQNGGETTNAADLWFTTATGGSLTEKMRISSAGAIKFNAYGAGTLVTDASGNITVSSGGGAGGPYLPLSAGSGNGLTGQLWFTGTTDASRKIFFTNAGSYAKGYMDAGSYGFQLSGSEKLTILSTGNVGIGETNPQAKLDVQPTATNRKVTRIANDVTSTYFYNTQVDAVLEWTCGSYYQAEVVITANQTNGGAYNNLYIRGIWSNNHTSHHWDELEHIGGLTGSSFTMSVGQNGTTTNSGRLELDFNYISGSFSQLNVRVTDFYGTHSYTIT